jgi:hypothetical protein
MMVHFCARSFDILGLFVYARGSDEMALIARQVDRTIITCFRMDEYRDGALVGGWRRINNWPETRLQAELPSSTSASLFRALTDDVKWFGINGG